MPHLLQYYLILFRRLELIIGKFNIIHSGVKVWNKIDEETKQFNKCNFK